MIVMMMVNMLMVMMMIKLVMKMSNKRWCAFKPDPPIHLLLATCKQRFSMTMI